MIIVLITIVVARIVVLPVIPAIPVWTQMVKHGRKESNPHRIKSTQNQIHLPMSRSLTHDGTLSVE